MDASTCFSVQAYLLAQTRRAFGWVLAPPVQVTLLSFDIAGNAASDPVHMALIIVRVAGAARAVRSHDAQRHAVIALVATGALRTGGAGGTCGTWCARVNP